MRLVETSLNGLPPQAQIDTVGVQMDLQSIARAEKIYVVSHGRYGTVDELFADRAIPFSGENRHGYTYSAQADGESHFRITARPSTRRRQPGRPSRSTRPCRWCRRGEGLSRPEGVTEPRTELLRNGCGPLWSAAAEGGRCFIRPTGDAALGDRGAEGSAKPCPA